MIQSAKIIPLVLLVSLTLATFAPLSSISTADAQSTDEIQSKINQRQEDIKALEKEIASYQKQINELGSQADSLAATIKSLDLTRKKLEADIKLTEKKITDKTIEIRQLGLDINDKEETIVDDRRIISLALKTMNESGSRSLPELLLNDRSLSDTWDSLDQLGAVQKGLVDRIEELLQAKTHLESNKKSSEKAKADLLALNNQLNSQKKIVEGTTAEKNQILKETKNSEASYAALLALREQQKQAFEREVTALEDALKIDVNPGSIPGTGSGVLKWPLDTVRITQYFGNTSFATANPQIYKSGSHPGVDFGASIGTQVKAAMTGVVVGSGNMDLAGGGRCRAYGKWIMVKHANGLSTLYAHLSLIGVTTGQTVVTGETIGYSGNTGASTGPHLHFGVYATEGVRITNLNSSSYCAGVLYPLADPSAYLNPLSYL